MSTKALVSWGAVGLVVFAVISDPIGTADMVRSLFGGLHEVGESGRRFISGVLR